VIKVDEPSLQVTQTRGMKIRTFEPNCVDQGW